MRSRKRRNDAEQDRAYNGDYSFVFANPEALVLNERWRKMIQMSVYQTSLFGIVADEAHVILYVVIRLQKSCVTFSLRLP